MHNFIPSKAEEEACKESNTPWQVTRRVVEIQDVHSAPIIDPQDPWKIKKAITPFEQASKLLVLSFTDTFAYVFQHWMVGMVEFLAAGEGNKQRVYIWDVTEENNTKKYKNAYVQMMPNDDYEVVCAELFTDRGLSIGDEIGLYWDTISNDFKFKLIKKGFDL